MILYIVADSEEHFRHQTHWWAHRGALERIAGDACVVLHYTSADPDIVARLAPWAIVHSGGSAQYDSYDVLDNDAYRKLITEWPVPQLGICRGHQVLAHYHGAPVERIRPIRDDEPDIAPYSPGWYKEWGFCPVRILASDPLFEGLGPVIRVKQAHAWEVKRLPEGFVHLAATDECPIQGYRHPSRALYGVQFHPEVVQDAYPDGTKVLENFFRIAKNAAPAGR